MPQDLGRAEIATGSLRGVVLALAGRAQEGGGPLWAGDHKQSPTSELASGFRAADTSTGCRPGVETASVRTGYPLLAAVRRVRTRSFRPSAESPADESFAPFRMRCPTGDERPCSATRGSRPDKPGRVARSWSPMRVSQSRILHSRLRSPQTPA